MTPVDPMDLDHVIRGALRVTRPERTMQFADIESDVKGRLVRGRMHKMVAIAAAVAGVVAMGALLSTQHAGHVQVQAPPKRALHGAGVATPTTRRAVSSTTTTLMRSRVVDSALPGYATPGTSPTDMPVAAEPPAPARRTTPTTAPEPRPQSSTTSTTSTTVAPEPAPYLVTLILDADGLHAPASVTTSGEVQIRFFDYRPAPLTVHRIRVTAPGYPDLWILMQWNGAYAGFGQLVVYPHLTGTVSYQAVDASTAEDIPSEHGSTEFFAH